MFMRLIYLKNSTFLGLKITVDTLIDVRNETSKHYVLKSVKQINLAFRWKCSSPFQGTAANKVQLTIAHGQLYRS